MGKKHTLFLIKNYKRKKMYISGAITTIGILPAKKNFSKWEKEINNNGIFLAVNPMKINPYKEGKSWLSYMIDDIILLLSCDAIFLMKNWKQSKGAKIERFVARITRKDIIYEE